MIETIIQNKWLILVSSELIAWVFLFLMGYFRYWNQNKIAFIIVTVLSCFFGYVPHIGIPVLMWLESESLRVLIESKDALLFDGFILLILIFGFTLGKKYVIRLDRWMHKKVQTKKLSL